jgi:hypothetical protein
MVDGIVAARAGLEGIPRRWLEGREALPSWVADPLASSGELRPPARPS